MFSDYPILAPVLAYIAFFFVLAIATFAARSAAVTGGKVAIQEVLTAERVYPKRTQWLSNAMNNQFETPVFFLAAAAFAAIADVQDGVMLTAAWVFTATRLVHAVIYVSVNHLIARFGVFLIGLAALAVMWGWIAHAAFTPV